MAGVFDTQIAHREYCKVQETYTYKDSNISLNSLLNIYLSTENSMKSKISDEMKADPEFWDQRPLTSEMIEYASQDVAYLPKMYSVFQELMSRSLLLKVFQKSSNCHFYSLINKNHSGIQNCKTGEYLGAYIK